ncbi:lysophospholipid acyltransferase family protein [Sanyastnella coralliicola]|uniref:lysophospholipid acyltransferase family protein n=1 Tax=Sanyastnella coralliicola TaxID=3069118 RepID=UPI0027B9AB14|nr:lysophospholipid acyltransferase family protein [Longitalea sp. SCSIO 12813]
MRIVALILIYPFVFLWTFISGLTGMILSIIFRARELTLSFVPGKMWAPVIFWLMGIKVKREGLENIDPDTPSIFVCNHGSFLDIPACVMKIPVNLNFIAKKELKKTPVVGWYITATDQIYIDRKNKDRAMESMAQAAEKIKQGKHVLTYPEGTRSKDGSIKMFRRGSFIIAKEGNIPIIPVAISGANAILPPGSFFAKRGNIELSIGEAFRPSDFPEMSVEDLANEARRRVIAMSNDHQED